MDPLSPPDFSPLISSASLLPSPLISFVFSAHFYCFAARLFRVLPLHRYMLLYANPNPDRV